MMSHELTKIFLANFNYLDAKGKRKGFFSYPFNQALTHDLEQVAKNLQEELFDYDKEEIEDSDKCKEIVLLIKDAFTKCTHAREDHATWQQYSYVEYVGPHIDCTTAGTEYEFKMPYKPSQFEKELLRGVEACITFLKTQFNNESLQMKKEFCALFYDISHFCPKEIRRNEHSWAP